MKKSEYKILLGLSLVIAVLVVCQLVVGSANRDLAGQVQQEQMILGNSRQISNVLQNLSRDVAIGSDTDPALKDLLPKYHLKVVLNVQGKAREYQ